jgi:myo-inositol-1-phosphate synthase
MRKKIRVAIAGVGNCASALIQGTSYYDKNRTESVGLTAYNIGGLEPGDIDYVAAFDVVDSKVGQDLSEAIFAQPNNTVKISDVEKMDVKVEKGEVLDGIGRHMGQKINVSEKPAVDIKKVLKDTQTEILLNYLPVGSRQATQYYAERCMDAGVCFINSIPVFIASESKWPQACEDRGLACAGDDVMSQLGATVLHKTIVKLFVDRGVKIDETYQLNVGGDMDFYNMLDEERLEDKRVSKTSAVAVMAPYQIPMRIGPSDFVEFLQNDKVCYISIRGKYFGNIPVDLDLKLRVVDAYNSAGVIIDAIRGTKLAINRGISGSLESISAYCFKHPPVQMPYSQAKANFLEFIEGKREK